MNLLQLLIVVPLGFMVNGPPRVLLNFKNRKKKNDQINTLLSKAYEYDETGCYEQAVKCYRSAETYFYEKNDMHNVARMTLMRALSYQAGKEHEQAIDAFMHAADMCRQVNDNESLGHVYMKMSETYEMQEIYQEAEKYQERAMNTWQKTGDESLIKFASYRLGLTQAKLGKKRDAVLKLETALKYYCRTFDLDKLVDVLIEAADVEAHLGAKKTALKNYRESEQHLNRLREYKKRDEIREKIKKLETEILERSLT